jgi:hypothetical protein
MKQKVMAILAVALSLAFGLAIAEIAFRLALPPVPGDEGNAAEYLAAAQRNPGAPRLFPAGYSAVFDIRGLYQGANEVNFQIGPKRFIPPEPPEGARYKVLFLGGSVTEGIFLQDHERWPARLNDGDRVATYNAGMSEAGMLAQYLTAKFLAERGDKFDLVVLATNHNDSTWSRRFLDINSRYRFETFATGLKTIFEKDFFAERKQPWFSLRTVAWAGHLLRVARLKASKASEGANKGDAWAGGSKAPSMVVEYLIKLQEGKQFLPKVKIDDCLEAGSPRKITETAYEDWKANLPQFRREIERLFGAPLLIVSEPAAYGAPGSSYYHTDTRVPATCMTTQGLLGIEIDDVVAFERERARVYLEAARMAGAKTFDLAGAMEPFSNGPEGGALFFDSIHPTPKGAEKFADFLRPAIDALLASQKKE